MTATVSAAEGQRDPFGGIASRVPTRYAPGATGRPYDYPAWQEWHPVIYYPMGAVEEGEGPIWLVEPYPAERADGADGLDPIEDDGGACVAVLRGAALPRPRGESRDGDWIIPGRALRGDSAYDVRVADQRQLMAAWCEAWAIASAMHVVAALDLKPEDVEVLLAAERGELFGDSRFAGTINELRWTPIGREKIGKQERVPTKQARRLRRTLAAVEAVSVRECRPARPWKETTYGLTRAGRAMLAEIRRQDRGPKRCAVCGCSQDRACPPGCSWRPALVPGAGPVCTQCPPSGPAAAR